MLDVYVHNPLSVKHFHGASAGNVHECSLKSSIGKASFLLAKVRTAARKSTRSAVSAKASEGRQPVYNKVHNRSGPHGGRFGGRAERRTLGAGEIQPVALGVINLHASGGGHGVPFARGKMPLRKTSIYSVKKGQKSTPKIDNGTAKKPHVGMDPPETLSRRSQAREGFCVRFVAPRAEQSSRLQ